MSRSALPTGPRCSQRRRSRCIDVVFLQTPAATPTAVQATQQVAQQLPLWIPVATFVVGQLFAIALEWLRGIFTARREKAARDQARSEAVDDRRADFQRETLLALQASLVEVHRATVRLHMADERTFRATGRWAAGHIGDEEGEQERLLRAQLNLLKERVLDEGLRDLVGQAQHAQRRIVAARDQENATTAYALFVECVGLANARAGELLRALY